MDKAQVFLYLMIGTVVYFVGGTAIFLVSFGQDSANQTTNSNVSLPTGGEGIPVTTANGTDIAEAAPAESIIDLFNYIIVVAVPAVLGLIGAIITFLRITGLGKKYSKQLDAAEAGIKMADMYGPKIKQNIVDSGLGVKGIEFVVNRLEEMRPGTKAEFESQVNENLPEIKSRVVEITEQTKQLHDRIPLEYRADSDKKLPRIVDGTVKV